MDYSNWEVSFNRLFYSLLTPFLQETEVTFAPVLSLENLPGFFQDLISCLLHRQTFLLQADDMRQLCNKLDGGLQKARWLAACNDHQYDDQCFCSHGSPFYLVCNYDNSPLGAMITHPRSPAMGGSHLFRFFCRQDVNLACRKV